MSETLPANFTTGVPAVTAPPSPSEWQALKEQASVIARSGLAPRAVSKPEQVLVIALKGRELGVPPMQALSHIHIVEGKPTLSAELMVALVQRAGHKLRVLETTDELCVVEGRRTGDPDFPYKTQFSMEDAKRANVAGKGPWKQYPAAMLRARAISALCRFAFADVLMGASYTPEELGAEVNEEGEVVGADPIAEDQQTQSGPAPKEVRSEQHQEVLNDLGDAFRSISPEKRPDRREVWGYATKGLENAQKSLDRLMKLAEKHPNEPPDELDVEEAEVVEDDASANATAEQIQRLTRLADELYDDKDMARDGYEWLQREKGKPFEHFTGDEAAALIAELEDMQMRES